MEFGKTENNKNNSEKEVWKVVNLTINTRDPKPSFRIPVDPLHLLIDSNISEIKSPDFVYPINIYIFKFINNKQYCSFTNNDCEFENKEQRYAYLYHAEKAFELIHHALYPICYFSDQKPQILYEYPKFQNEKNKPDILTRKRMKTLTNDVQKQILLLAITSAIYYLFQKGYTIPDFSLDYVFLENGDPKILGYVNYQNLEYISSINNFRDAVNEIDIVKRLSLAILEILNSTRAKPDEKLTTPSNTNPKLQDLLDFSQNSNLDNFPTLKQFAKFFYENDYCKYAITDVKVSEYKHSLEKTDVISFQNIKFDTPEFSVCESFINDEEMNSFVQIINSNQKRDQNMIDGIHSLLTGETKNIPAYLWPQINIFDEPDNFPLLNRVPEHIIKNLAQYRPNNSNILFEMLCYEKHDLLLYDYPNESSDILKIVREPFVINSPDDYYEIYKKIIQKASTEDNLIFNPKPYMPIAIIYLKKAVKEGHREATIMLAKQYFKGKMVPANYKKAISLLSSKMFEGDEEISKIKTQIEEKINKIEKEIENNEIYNELKQDQRNPTLLIYVAFSFYSGLNGFPKSTSHAVHFYRKASKLSPDYMCLLGTLYYRGFIFPRNIKRAQNCFKRSAVGNRYEDGSTGDVIMTEKAKKKMQTAKSEINISTSSILSDGKLPKPVSTPRRKLRFSGQFENYTYGGSIKGKILDNIFRKHLWRSYMNCVDLSFVVEEYLQCPTSLSFDDTMILPMAVFIAENTQIPMFYDSPAMKHYKYYDERNYYKNLVRYEIKFDLLSYQLPCNFINIIFEKEQNEYYDVFSKVENHLQKVGIQIHDVDKTIFNAENEDTENDEEKNDKNENINENSENEDDSNNYSAAADDDEKNLNQIIYKKELKKKFSIIDSTSNSIYEFDNEEIQLNTPIDSILYFPQSSLPDTNPIKMKEHIGLIFQKKNKSFTSSQSNKNAEIWNDTPMYSTKICISPEITKAEEEEDNATLQLRIANCYYDGLCGYPVNYKEASRFYRKSADNGNSEAQWKYAQMCANGLGTRQDPKLANEYFKKSVELKDDDGMLRYALFIRHFLLDSNLKENLKLPSFQELIERSAIAGNIEAIHQLGICYESSYSGTDEITKALENYSQAADNGHIESFTRLAQLMNALDDDDEDQQFPEYSKYLMYSLGLFDIELMLDCIIHLNKLKNYKEARIIIDVGMTIEKQVFTPYLAENISIYCTDGQPDYEKANSLINPFLNTYEREKYKHDEGKSVVEDEDDDNDYFEDLGQFEKYVMVKLRILVEKNQHELAAEELVHYKDCLSTNSREDFIEFYKKIDKKIARKYSISISFYSPEYRKIVNASNKIKEGKYCTQLDGIIQLKKIVEKNPNNPYALLKLGKLYMKGKWFRILRNPIKALDLIQKAAQKDSPEARLTCGKIYFYGFDCEPNTRKAFKYFWKAFTKRNRDPRAGFYLSDERFLTTDDKKINKFTDPVKIKEKDALDYLTIAADFGYDKALFKLGLKYEKDPDHDIKKKGCEMIISAGEQGNKDALKYIKENPHLFNEDLYDLSDISISE